MILGKIPLMSVIAIFIRYRLCPFRNLFVDYINKYNFVISASIAIAPKKKLSTLIILIWPLIQNNLCIVGVRSYFKTPYDYWIFRIINVNENWASLIQICSNLSSRKMLLITIILWIRLHGFLIY